MQRSKLSGVARISAAVEMFVGSASSRTDAIHICVKGRGMDVLCVVSVVATVLVNFIVELDLRSGDASFWSIRRRQ